mgnify:FL=1
MLWNLFRKLLPGSAPGVLKIQYFEKSSKGDGKMKKNVKGLVSLGISAALALTPSMSLLASNSYDIEMEDVGGSYLFPGDSVSGMQTVYIGDNWEAGEVSDGTWTNSSKGKVYRVNPVEEEEGALWMEQAGYQVTVKKGSSRSSGTEYGSETYRHYTAKDYEEVSAEEAADRAFYEAWTEVVVKAAEAGEGKAFDHWEVEDQAVTLNDPLSEETSFTMTDSGVVLSAVYTDALPETELITEAPAELPEEAPVEVTDDTFEIPEEAPSDMPEEAPADTAEEAAIDSSDETAFEVPEEAPFEISDETAFEIPEETTAEEAPFQISDETSFVIPEEAASDIAAAGQEQSADDVQEGIPDDQTMQELMNEQQDALTAEASALQPEIAENSAPEADAGIDFEQIGENDPLFDITTSDEYGDITISDEDIPEYVTEEPTEQEELPADGEENLVEELVIPEKITESEDDPDGMVQDLYTVYIDGGSCEERETAGAEDHSVAYEAGETVHIQADRTAGYRFETWSASMDIQPEHWTTEELVFVMPEQDVFVTAHYVEDPNYVPESETEEENEITDGNEIAEGSGEEQPVTEIQPAEETNAVDDKEAPSAETDALPETELPSGENTPETGEAAAEAGVTDATEVTFETETAPESEDGQETEAVSEPDSNMETEIAPVPGITQETEADSEPETIDDFESLPDEFFNDDLEEIVKGKGEAENHLASGAEAQMDGLQEETETEKATEQDPTALTTPTHAVELSDFDDITIEGVVVENGVYMAHEGAKLKLKATEYDDRLFRYFQVFRTDNQEKVEVKKNSKNYLKASFIMPDTTVYVEAVYIDKNDSTVQVVNGSGSGNYEEGTYVEIEADKAPEGYVFAKWVVSTENVDLDDARSAKTGFVMPDEAVKVKATYKEKTYKLTVESGNGSGEYKKQDTVDLAANYPASGKEFDKWVVTSENAEVSAPDRYYTKITMPAADVSVKATYKDGPQPSSCYISDIGEGAEYLKGETISFTAYGAGMDNTNPNPGDYRFRPAVYQVGSASGSWSSAPYTTKMAINATGEYNLTVTYNKDIFDGQNWVSDGTTTTQTIRFFVVNNHSVSTGDSSPILLLACVAGGALLLIIILIILKAKRRK